MPTLSEAKDTILTEFSTFWAAEVISRGILTSVPYVVYPNVDFKPDKDIRNWPQPYVRINIQHVSGGQVSLGGTSRRFRREGLVLTQVNVLKGDKDGLGGTVLNDLLAQVAVDAFDGKHFAGNIWFRDVFPIEEGPDDQGQFFRTTVTAEFTYDEIK